MFSAIIGDWHCWQGNQFMMSHEPTKRLLAFSCSDDAITYLYLNVNKNTARSLHKAIKEASQ